MSSIFRFKKFEVNQRNCAMKINTDAVLIGALASHIHPLRILDIGTGTGVIAMMLAQRFEDSKIDAVEIDGSAYWTAKSNFENSIFSNRLQIFPGSFVQMPLTHQYDLIVSNPPFYTNSLHNPDGRKKLARHTDLDFFVDLLQFANQALAENGMLQLIVPTELVSEIQFLGKKFGFELAQNMNIRSFEHTDIIRRIVTFKKNTEATSASEEFVIYKDRGVHSDAYKTLLQPFFLAF